MRASVGRRRRGDVAGPACRRSRGTTTTTSIYDPPRSWDNRCPPRELRGAAETTCSRQRLPRQLWPPRPRGNARTGRSNAYASSATRCSGPPGPRRRTAPRPPRRTGRRRPIGGLRTCSRTRPGRPYRAGTSARAPRVRRGCPLSLPPSGFLGHELQTHGPETPKSEGRGVMKVILYYVIAFHKHDTTESFKTQSYHFIAWLAQNDEKAPRRIAKYNIE